MTTPPEPLAWAWAWQRAADQRTGPEREYALRAAAYWFDVYQRGVAQPPPPPRSGGARGLVVAIVVIVLVIGGGVAGGTALVRAVTAGAASNQIPSLGAPPP